MKFLRLLPAVKNKIFLYNNSAPELHSDTMERIDELEKRNVFELSKLSQLMLQVDVKATDSMNKFSQGINDAKGVFSEEKIQELAQLSVGSEGEEMGKLYRTEVVARMIQFLGEQPELIISQTDASRILERTMAALPYRSGTESKSLYDAMSMVSHDRDSIHSMPDALVNKFTNKTEREALADKMKNQGENDIQLGEKFTIGGVEYGIAECEILTGGAMTKMNPKLLNQFKIKNAIVEEVDGKVQILARMQNGCEGNLVIIVPDPDPEPVIPGFEKVDWNQKIAIGDLPPDIFGEFFKLNPTNHWVEYKDLYNYMEGLPEQKRAEFEQNLKLYVSGAAQANIQNHLDSLRKDTSIPQDQRSLFDAQWKLTQGDDTNVNEAVVQLQKLIADPATTAEVKTMAQDVLSQVESQFLQENAEVLAYRDMNGLWMFRTHLVSQIDDMKDDWWITNKLQFLWTKNDASEQAEIKMKNDFLSTIEELEGIMEAGTANTLPEALALLPDQEKADAFKKAYETFIKTEMAGTVMDKDPDKISKQEMKDMPVVWLKMADELREKGQYGQAAEIYESIFLGKIDPTKMKTLTPKENEKIEKSISLDEIKKDLNERGMLEGKTTAEIATLVSATYDLTIQQLKEKEILTQSIDEVDPTSLFAAGSTEHDALQKYQDMKGLEAGWDISDETKDFLKEELIINCALIAVSGGVGTLARIGATTALRSAARGAGRAGVRGMMGRGATSLSRVGARGVSVGRFGKITASGVGMASLEGAVFHEVEHGLVHGELWSEDHVRGMAMSAVMFNLFRGGNALYERTAGNVTSKLAGKQYHLNDFLKNAAGRDGLGRGEVLGNAFKHRLVRTTGEAIPFHIVNGGAAGVLDGDWERLTSGKEFAKNWSTLMMLSLLPRGKALEKKPPKPEPKPIPEPQKVLPPHEGQKSLPPHEGQKVLPPHEGQKELSPHEGQKELPPHEGRIYRTLDQSSKDGGVGTSPLEGAVVDGVGTFGTPAGNRAQRSGGKGSEKFEQNLRNERDLIKKNEKREMTERSKNEREHKLNIARENLKEINRLQKEISTSFEKKVTELSKLIESDPVAAKKELKLQWNRETTKLATQTEHLRTLERNNQITRDELFKGEQAIAVVENNLHESLYKPNLKKIDAQINKIQKEKEEAFAENKLRDEAARKAADVPTVNLRENFESMIGEGAKIKVKVEGMERMKDFEITKVKMYEGKVVGIKAKVDGSLPYDFKLEFKDGKINIKAPNKGKTLDWNITQVEGTTK